MWLQPSKPSGSETGSSTGTRGAGPGMLDTDTGITAAGWRYKLPRRASPDPAQWSHICRVGAVSSRG